ncbi:MAG: hypothetical protein QXD46_00115 [Thermofilum sp.]|uniref:Uncharacterized protein n=1 Tax=Thermofilum pendens TaxID=2269 RepID=A0A7C4D5K0_THEPE
MREFILVTGEATLADEPFFSRLLNAAFFLSHGIRKDVILRVLIQDCGVLISFVGDKLKHLHIDEQSMAGVLRKVERTALLPPRRPVSVHYGVIVEPSARLNICGGRYYLVSRRGRWLHDVLKRCENLRFVIGEEARVRCGGSAQNVKVTVFPKPVDTTLAILNIELDRICGMPSVSSNALFPRL